MIQLFGDFLLGLGVALFIWGIYSYIKYGPRVFPSRSLVNYETQIRFCKQ